MLHVLHGPNTLARDEDIGKMKAQLGDPDIVSLNLTVFDVSAAFRDIQSACEAMPFLAERRLVIARNWLSRPGAGRKKAAKPATDDPVARMADYADAVPDFTALVLAEDATLPASHPVMQAAERLTAKKRARVALFDVPADPVAWIVGRARTKGGSIARDAAQLLSVKINRGNKNDRDHFDEDSRVYVLKLDSELDKLVAYASGREVNTADVELLVQDEEQSDIFRFLDAISARDGETAYAVMRGVLGRGESPLVVVAHLARQMRTLIAAKENERLTPEELGQLLGVHPYPAKKAMQQAGRFTMAELRRDFLAVAETDVAIKTGQMEDVVALDVLVADICR